MGAIAAIAAAVFAWLTWDASRRLVSITFVHVNPDYIGRGAHLIVRLRARRSEVFVRQVAILPRHGQGLKSEVVAGSRLGLLKQGTTASVVFPWTELHFLHVDRARGPARWIGWYDAEDRFNRQPIPKEWRDRFRHPDASQ